MRSSSSATDGTFETVVSGLDQPTSLELVGRVGFVVTFSGRSCGSTGSETIETAERQQTKTLEHAPRASVSLLRLEYDSGGLPPT